MLYFSWLPSHTIPPMSELVTTSLPLFSVHLTHGEGAPAELLITLPNPVCTATAPIPQGGKGALFWRDSGENPEERMLFIGSVRDFVHTQRSLVKITLVAQAPDAAERVEALCTELFKSPVYDPLFDDAKGTLEGALAAHSKTLFWDRTSPEVRLSDFFVGKKGEEVSCNAIDRKSLSYEITPCVTKVDVMVEAQWMQHVRGFIDLSPHLRGLFREKYINTYTGKSLLRSWPRAGLSMAGYRVVYSKLKPIDPPVYAGPHAHALELCSHCAEHTQWVKRSWFEGSLLLSWYFRQKRQEVLSFSLTSAAVSPLTQACAPAKKMNLRLQRIAQECDTPFWHPIHRYQKDEAVRYGGKTWRAKEKHESGLRFEESLWVPLKNGAVCPEYHSSFFLTQRGYKALEHAIERARVCLAAHARCVRVSFAGPVALLAHLSPDNHVILTDPRLPQGKVTGKVVDMQLKADHFTDNPGVVSITLACCLDSSPVASSSQCLELSSSTDTNAYACGYSEDGWAECAPDLCTSPGGIQYERYDHQAPSDPYAEVPFFRPQQLLRMLHIENPPEIQEEKIRSLHSEQDLPNTSRHLDTKIVMQFQRLQLNEPLVHTIDVRIRTPFLLPQK